MPDCSQCGALIEEGQTVCPVCGTPAAGMTASFQPVVEDTSRTTAGSEVAEGPVLVVRKGPQPGERFYVDRPRLTVGRDPGSDIFLNDMTVSRAHAVLTLSGDTVSVSDAGSLNGTYVNGVCIDRIQLFEGDVVQIGTFQMTFHGEKRP